MPGWAQEIIDGLQVGVLNLLWGILKGLVGTLVDLVGNMLIGINNLITQLAVLGTAMINPGDLAMVFPAGSGATGDPVMGDLFTDVAVVIAAAIGQVRGIAYIVLAIMLGIQAVKIMQQPDNMNSSGIPYVEKFAWMWITFALMKLALDYSVDFTLIVFNSIQDVTTHVFGTMQDFNNEYITNWVNNLKATIDSIAFSTDTSEGGNVDLANAGRTIFMAVLAPVILFVGTLVLYCTIMLTTYGRWIQTYFYLSFSPLMFSFIGMDETRPMFISFLKSVMCCALSFLGTIVLLCVVRSALLPFIIGRFVDVTDPGSWIDILGMFAMGALFTFAISKVGSWVRDLVG